MKTTIATLSALTVSVSLAVAQEHASEAPGKRPSPEQVFKKLDTNGDGCLSLEEFKESPLGKRDAVKAEEIYHKMDMNSNNQVTLEEFKAFRPARNPEEIFKQLDTNGDGSLSLEEFKAGPLAKWNPAKAEEIYHKMDVNSNNQVTLEEFKAFHHTWSPAEIFKRLDTNNDGVLSLEEFKASPLMHKDPAKAEEIFHKLDVNGDGKVTLEEFKPFHQRHGNHGGTGAAAPPPQAPAE